MALSEFELIASFFKQSGTRHDVSLGIGDDCALLECPAGSQLAVSMDTMVSGVHFPQATSPFDIGYKLAAVNLSDMAAMGADPAWATLAITLPNADEAWLRQFCKGLFTLLNEYNVQLVGGDTTRGPLTVTMQMHGFVEKGMAIKRSGAEPGDKIYVSGYLGDAALGLQSLLGQRVLAKKSLEPLLQSLNRPSPRIVLGQALLDIASAMVDVSDGLLADLTHILVASGVGASVDITKLPLSPAFTAVTTLSESWPLAAKGGDDYELCFTVPQAKEQQLLSVTSNLSCPITCIGEIKSDIAGIGCLLPSGEVELFYGGGYMHFTDEHEERSRC